MWAPTGVDESVVQPAADEGEVQQWTPLTLGAGSSLWGERSGGGERAGGGISPPSLRDGVGSNCKRAGLRAPPPLRPSLFVLAPIMAALGDIRTTLP